MGKQLTGVSNGCTNVLYDTTNLLSNKCIWIYEIVHVNDYYDLMDLSRKMSSRSLQQTK